MRLRSGSHRHPLGLLDETTARKRLFTLDLHHPAKRHHHNHHYKEIFMFLLPVNLAAKWADGEMRAKWQWKSEQPVCLKGFQRPGSSGSPMRTWRTPVHGNAHQLSLTTCAQQRRYWTAVHICDFLLPMYLWMKNTSQKLIPWGNVHCSRQWEGKWLALVL